MKFSDLVSLMTEEVFKNFNSVFALDDLVSHGISKIPFYNQIDGDEFKEGIEYEKNYDYFSNPATLKVNTEMGGRFLDISTDNYLCNGKALVPYLGKTVKQVRMHLDMGTMDKWAFDNFSGSAAVAGIWMVGLYGDYYVTHRVRKATPEEIDKLKLRPNQKYGFGMMVEKLYGFIPNYKFKELSPKSQKDIALNGKKAFEKYMKVNGVTWNKLSVIYDTDVEKEYRIYDRLQKEAKKGQDNKKQLGNKNSVQLTDKGLDL